VADKVLKSMEGAKIDKRKIRVQYAENKKPQTRRFKKRKRRH
jgi:RNA recognition motif-containing protein